MKLLVDNQLPIALARFLSAEGFECQHVLDLGWGEVDDIHIWRHAQEHGVIIVSKDEDFFNLATQTHDSTAGLIWVRVGNCRKQALLEAFASALPEMRERLAQGQRIIEIR